MRLTWQSMHKDDKRKLVLDLVAEKLSAGEIAARIGGASRNAIIGFCHRENIALGGRKKPKVKSASAPVSNVVPIQNAKPKAKKPKEADVLGEVVELKHAKPRKKREQPKGTIKIMDMPLFGRCRGPVLNDYRKLDADQIIFCGRETEPESSWCLECQRKYTMGRVKAKKVVDDNGEPIQSKSPKRRQLYRWLR